MNSHVARHYQDSQTDPERRGKFHRVLSLLDDQMEWEAATHLAPQLPRGWYELARLSSNDRVEFCREHWNLVLPYVPHVNDKINQFFDQLDDVGIYLTQPAHGERFVPQMVYSVDGERGFFHGFPPTAPHIVAQVRLELPEMLPEDYRGFLKLHDGFSKATDTGLISLEFLPAMRQELIALLKEKEPLMSHGEEINPRSLIPFYQSFGMQAFQCFYADWYPQEEMGNVYYSGTDHTVSDLSRPDQWGDELAFPTFLDWLIFYLESVPF